MGLSQAVLSFAAKKSHSPDIIHALERLLRTLESVASSPESLDEKLSDYVFFPLSHVLRESQKLPVRPLELCLLCLAILLETGWRENIAPNLSGQLLILLTFMADNGSIDRKLEKTSEDLQRIAFRCLSLLFASLGQTRSGRESLISTANIPQLGHTVAVVLDGVTKGPSNEVQLSAVSALQSLLENLADNDVLSKFFPGIVSSLTKVLTPSTKSKRAYKLLEASLKVLARLLASVLGDENTQNLPPEASSEDHSTTTILRTKKWLEATSGQVKQALANIMRIWQHDREQVREALFELCTVVLRDCHASLSESASMTLETLIMLSSEGSQSHSDNTLIYLLGVKPELGELLRSSLRMWVLSLPRVMESNDDLAKRRLIQRISAAYQMLLDQGIDLSNVDMIMAASLRDSVTLAVKDSRAVTQNSSDELAVKSSDIIPTLGRDVAMSFSDIFEGRRGQMDTIIEVKALLKRLSSSKSGASLLDDLLQLCIHSTGQVQLVNFWLASQSLKAMAEPDSSMEQYLIFDESSVEKRNTYRDQLYAISIDVLGSFDANIENDWRLQALALEVVALQAQWQKKYFREELIDALYPVVHLVGSPIVPLRQHAITCLNILADSCGYKNAGNLIVGNVDYLTNAVAFKLNGPDISPQAPMVLLVMIRLSGPSLIPYLDDVVENIFIALEQYHGYPRLVELLFAVLREVAEKSVKTPQLVLASKPDGSDLCNLGQSTKMSNVIDDIKSLKNKSRDNDNETLQEVGQDFPKRPWSDQSQKRLGPSNLVEEMSLSDDAEGNEEPSLDESPEPEPEPLAPRTYNMLLNISQLTQHYLPSSSSQLRASLLSLLDTAIPVLATHENSFLPLINAVWPVLIPRLDDPEAYVVVCTLDTIGLFCKHAGHFMRGRIEDLWPSILDLYSEKVLKEIDGEPLKTHRGSRQDHRHTSKDLALQDLHLQRHPLVAYVGAPTRMLWNGLVHVLTVFANYVPISERIFDDVLHILEPLLEEREDICHVLGRRNPDAVWLAISKRIRRPTGNEASNNENDAQLRENFLIPPCPNTLGYTRPSFC